MFAVKMFVEKMSMAKVLQQKYPEHFLSSLISGDCLVVLKPQEEYDLMQLWQRVDPGQMDWRHAAASSLLERWPFKSVLIIVYHTYTSLFL